MCEYIKLKSFIIQFRYSVPALDVLQSKTPVVTWLVQLNHDRGLTIPDKLYISPPNIPDDQSVKLTTFQY